MNQSSLQIREAVFSVQSGGVITLCSAILLLVMFAFGLPVLAQDEAEGPAPGPTLSAIQARGQLICGVNEEVFGFGFLNPNTGEISGLQVDFCRALAAATLGEAAAVDLQLLTLDTPLSELIAGGVDVLFSHNDSPALRTAAQSGIDQSPAVIFYDGASVMVRAERAGAGWEDLRSETICLLTESTSELDFVNESQRRELDYDPMHFTTIADMRAAFADGRCNAMVLERSLLEIVRQSSPNPETLIVWSEPFALAPLSPFYHYGDEQWAFIVDWTLWGLIEAEKQGITSQNIDEFLRLTNETDDAYQARVGQTTAWLLDAGLGLGDMLGLAPDFMVTIIRQVGNYGEIYDRNLGPLSNLPIERSLNRLVHDGGILDAGKWR